MVDAIVGGQRLFAFGRRVAALQRLEGRVVEIGIVLGHQRLEPLPLLVGGREKLVGLGRCPQESLHRLEIVLGPALAEHEADHGDLALGADDVAQVFAVFDFSRFFDHSHAQRRAKPISQTCQSGRVWV